MTYDEVKELLKNNKDLSIQSEGKVMDEIGYDEDGFPVAWGYTCTKPGCNCVGSWWNGDQGLIVNNLILKQ